MKTTLQEILNLDPCGQKEVNSGWGKAINSLGTADLSTEVTPMDILKHAGIEDAVWCLRVFDYEDYCLFNAEVVESVLHIFEDRYPLDMCVRYCIQAIKDYHAGLICKDELKNAANAAEAAASNIVYNAAYNADSAAYNASYSAAYAAYSAAYAAATAAVRATANHATTDAAANAKATIKWKEIEQIYIKHFGGK